MSSPERWKRYSGRMIHQHAMKPPATIIVGEVISLRGQAELVRKAAAAAGRRIVVTRAREQAGTPSAGMLHALGAEVIELPTIEIRPALDYAALDAALAHLSDYDWLIFTSVNGVRFFFRGPRILSAADVRSIRGRICAIGPATRDSIERFHLKVDVTAAEYVAEGVLEALKEYDLAGARILIARAAAARDLLPTELTLRGAHVDVVEAYRTVTPENLAADAANLLLRKPELDRLHQFIDRSESGYGHWMPRALAEGVRTASIVAGHQRHAAQAWDSG